MSISEKSSQFGEILREYRISCGMTQQELADFSTLSVRAIRDLERGKVARPRKETLRLLVKALDLPADDRERFESLLISARGNRFRSADPNSRQRNSPASSPREDAPDVVLAYLPERGAVTPDALNGGIYADVLSSLAKNLNLTGRHMAIVVLSPDRA
ncbi:MULTISPECIES: helix-turn-helix transcriptional regulator [unclassified Streptomyces]|uniref:helix-turn-helix transcriptional regulator n=1 Tax=unclassified Streptomyces TaxID=2593676 RepID=UPI00336A7E45